MSNNNKSKKSSGNSGKVFKYVFNSLKDGKDLCDVIKDKKIIFESKCCEKGTGVPLHSFLELCKEIKNDKNTSDLLKRNVRKLQIIFDNDTDKGKYEQFECGSVSGHKKSQHEVVLIYAKKRKRGEDEVVVDYFMYNFMCKKLRNIWSIVLGFFLTIAGACGVVGSFFTSLTIFGIPMVPIIFSAAVAVAGYGLLCIKEGMSSNSMSSSEAERAAMDHVVELGYAKRSTETYFEFEEEM